MALLEGCGLAWECRFLLAVSRAVVGHGEGKASNRPELVLVAEFDRLASIARLRDS